MPNPDSSDDPRLERATSSMIMFAWLWAAVILYFAFRAVLT